MVYAATSTRDMLRALEAQFEATNAVDLIFNFGSSGDLARQIVAAARADVFLSAGEPELDLVEAAGLVAEGTRVGLLSNRLVVIGRVGWSDLQEPSAYPAALARPEVRRISLADVETVPAGRYAREWLQRAGVWQQLEARVLPAIDVRAALAAVEAGGADVGVVYRTDAASSRRVLVLCEVPAEEGPAIVYPAAALRRGVKAPSREALNFLSFLSTDEARATFEAHGFTVLPGRVGLPGQVGEEKARAE